MTHQVIERIWVVSLLINLAIKPLLVRCDFAAIEDWLGRTNVWLLLQPRRAWITYGPVRFLPPFGMVKVAV